MDLSVITVTWNSKDQIERQIRSVISGCNNINFEEIIIDNASNDGTVDFIKQNFPSVKMIVNEKNLGFGAANNQGVKIASGDFFLFLNPDMKILPESLDKILDWMKQNPKIGVASCKLVDKNGQLNREATPRRFPKLWEQLALILKIPHFFPNILDQYQMKDFDGEKEQEVDSVRGAFMLVRRELIEKLGWGFDPRYYIWYEDVDICRECWRNGFKVVYTPIIECVDYIGQSFKKRDTYWKQKNFTKSMLQYFQKWEPWYKWVWIWFARPVGLFLAFIKDKIIK